MTAYNPIVTANGKIGNAQYFDGSDDYITLNSAVLLQSLSVWIDFSSITSISYFLGGTIMGVRYNGLIF